MIPCAHCGATNPPGSKFCAACGGALPKNELCASCGLKNPEGSRFCKGCGKPLETSVVPKPPATQAGTAHTTGIRSVQPQSQNLQKVKTMLVAGALLYAIGIFLMYSELSAIDSMYGAYSGFVANTDLQWFMILVDVACAALGLYAITRINIGETRLAKTMLIVNAGLGALFLLRGLAGPVLYSALNAALVATGIYGWRLIAREQATTV